MNISKIIVAGIKYISDSNYRFLFNASRGRYDSMPDEEYLRKIYEAKTGLKLNLDNPMLFNEKLQWLKLNDRKPVYTQMVDKADAKEYVRELIGEEYVIPTIGIWDCFDDIDFEALPSKFVIKTTHGCGGMYICRDKKNFDKKKARKIIEKTMRTNYYYNVREWPYKNVIPRVLVEEYVQNGDELNLTVYKVLNFNGEPRIIQNIQNDKTKDETIDYFDTEWNLLEMRQNYPNSENPKPKPMCLDEMLELSKKCSYGFPFLRTDWYEVNGKVFFSEFTFYSDAGMEPIYPERWNKELGDMILLP